MEQQSKRSSVDRRGDSDAKPSPAAESSLSTAAHSGDRPSSMADQEHYRLYKRRFAGLFGLVALNLVAALASPWFGPIASNVSEDFDISLNQVNWLGNIVACVYVLATPIIPWIVSKYGVRRCCDVGCVFLLLSSWIRYAGTPHSLSSSGAYTLLIIGQFLSAISQAIFQVLAPKYSESWFNLKGRTTATAIISISNPVGSALGQLISPFISTTRQSILVLGVISTAVLPCLFLISDKPPSPPTHAAAQKPQTIYALLLNLIGKGKPASTDGEEDGTFMTLRERIDFVSVTFLFGVFVGVTLTFTILSAQYLTPYGYSDTTAGLMGAVLLLSGIVTAGIAAPLFDRVFTHHLALAMKILTPIMTGCWLSLVWAVRSGDTGALFAIFGVVGACSLTLLPVSLELSVELTRAADASSAILWFTGNVFAIIFILAESALRSGPDSSPPMNMHKSLIFQAVFVCVVLFAVIPLKGEQKRRKRDEKVEHIGVVDDKDAEKNA